MPTLAAIRTLYAPAMRIHSALTHPLLLSLAIAGLALCMLLGEGPYKLFVIMIKVIVLLIAGEHLASKRPLPPGVVALAGAGVLVWLINLLAPGDLYDHRHFKNLVSMLFIAAGAVWLPASLAPLKFSWREVGVTILAISLLAHSIAQLTCNQWQCNGVGLFENIHFLSLTSSAMVVASISLLFTGDQLTLRQESHWHRLLYALMAAAACWLLLATRSRPGWLAVIAAGLVCIPFLPARPRVGLISTLLCAPLALYFSGLTAFRQRIDHFIANVAAEERIWIWGDTLNLLSTNTLREWCFGHGVGSFRFIYEIDKRPEAAGIDFPHNFFLEVLYNSGFAGLSILLLGLGVCYALLIRIRRQAAPRLAGAALICMSLLTAVFVHTFFTLPFHARYTAFLLGLLIGWTLLLNRIHKDDTTRPAISAG